MSFVPFAVMRQCFQSFPDRPKLDPVEWPYRPDELDDFVDTGMQALHSVMASYGE